MRRGPRTGNAFARAVFSPAVEHGLAETLAGLALFLFPGVAWSLALAPGLPRPLAVALAPVLAFTLGPLALFVLNLFFGAPLRPAPMAFFAAALGLAGLAVRLHGPVVRRVVP